MHDRPGSRPRRLAGTLVGLGLLAALTACEVVDAPGSGAGTGAAAETPAPVAGSALAALDGLEVKGRAPKTGYDRDRFGDGWVDTDRNGCDTRNDVLARDLTGVAFEPGTRDCVVRTGALADPYSGSTIAFRRGQDTSDDVQVDHVVALSDAWQKGAQGWDEERRVRFANDPLNLLAVDGPLNMQKGDGDAATWLPPASGYRCAYVARQVAVKAGYGLWVTQAERDAMAGVLARCPEEPLPAGAAPPATDGPAPDAAAAPMPGYTDCAAVRAAGAAPIHRGEPGFSERFDGDGDGVGCES
ncbi:GmrSD restriction endonuclease domain-containing protein [Blastococcus sp. SYSU DS0533]